MNVVVINIYSWFDKNHNDLRIHLRGGGIFFVATFGVNNTPINMYYLSFLDQDGLLDTGSSPSVVDG